MTAAPPTARLLFGVLGGPLAWALQFSIHYAMTPFLCADLTLLPVHATSAVALLACASALFVAARSWRQLVRGDAPHDRIAQRARSLAFAGILASSFALFVIAATAVVPVLVHPCSF